MKKILSLVLILSMLFVCSTIGYCESSEIVDFTPVLTNYLDKDLDEWFATGTNRALLTCSIAMDLGLYVDDEVLNLQEAFAKSTYIGRSEELIMITLHGGEKDITIYYCPSLDCASYVLEEKCQDFILEYAFNESCEDGYYKNESSDLMAAAIVLSSIING